MFPFLTSCLPWCGLLHVASHPSQMKILSHHLLPMPWCSVKAKETRNHGWSTLKLLDRKKNSSFEVVYVKHSIGDRKLTESVGARMGVCVVLTDLAFFYFFEIFICVYIAELEFVDLARLVSSRSLSLPSQCWNYRRTTRCCTDAGRVFFFLLPDHHELSSFYAHSCCHDVLLGLNTGPESTEPRPVDWNLLDCGLKHGYHTLKWTCQVFHYNNNSNTAFAACNRKTRFLNDQSQYLFSMSGQGQYSLFVLTKQSPLFFPCAQWIGC